MIENIAANIQYSIKTTIINTKCQKDISGKLLFFDHLNDGNRDK